MNAAVASGHAETSEAIARVLGSGGNAFDAACAGGFASAVCEPALTSLGGGGFLLARRADGDATLFDFFVDTPGLGRDGAALEPHFFPVLVDFGASQQTFNVGRGSVAVPGVLAGLLHVHERLGRLPLERVVEPAARLAQEGFELSDRQAHFLELLNPIYTLEAGTRAIYTRDGEPLEPGERLRDPDLADFLHQLPAQTFYSGDLAGRIAADLRADGLLTLEDLRAYRVIEREPLRVPYRGATLLTNPLPSFGGTLLGRSLELLEADHPALPVWGSPEHATLLIEIQQRVDPMRADPEGLRRVARGTTHLSVVDAEGNAASMTTSNGEGSGYVVPGTGVMLNNMMGEDDLHPEGFHATPAGERVSSGMSPSMVEREGSLELVIGSGGSKRIRTALFQVLTAALDYGHDIESAVRAPRLHWDGEALQLEPGFPPETVDALGARWPVNPFPEPNVYFGGVHAIAPRRGAAGDPRRGGSAAMLAPSRGAR